MDVSMASYPLLLLLFVSNMGRHVNHVARSRQPPIVTDELADSANYSPCHKERHFSPNGKTPARKTLYPPGCFTQRSAPHHWAVSTDSPKGVTATKIE
tara:strand:+ start:699 stop:992 length:294 start_codon:yes stop_codon:yes gene_type:complete